MNTLSVALRRRNERPMSALRMHTRFTFIETGRYVDTWHKSISDQVIMINQARILRCGALFFLSKKNMVDSKQI